MVCGWLRHFPYEACFTGRWEQAHSPDSGATGTRSGALLEPARELAAETITPCSPGVGHRLLVSGAVYDAAVVLVAGWIRFLFVP
jgi:hypothetical protein